eukprot:UN30678
MTGLNPDRVGPTTSRTLSMTTSRPLALEPQLQQLDRATPPATRQSILEMNTKEYEQMLEENEQLPESHPVQERPLSVEEIRQLEDNANKQHPESEEVFIARSQRPLSFEANVEKAPSRTMSPCLMKSIDYVNELKQQNLQDASEQDASITNQIPKES